ncbi:hypothetical protein TanjilG_00938 [Lupinus angustifolius]|uniref:Uncharacterized protein n=1 Tax=Lupinus angustifolius TaxID=3871 RepID=A0A4P1QQX4_LUPAN|nr:PREDICTED: putative cytochrome c oxidase subunit 6b-like [Lupinus angustifolius]OIV92804.1 hypothetical protein TanjilG_00938 [Lupinus angustifolius]
MSASAPVDPHDKMRARDVNKVARGEQAPRPAHEYGTVSPPPPPSSTNTSNNNKVHKCGAPEKDGELRGSSYQHCYVKYVEYHRCINQKGEKAPECNKLDTYVKSSCPTQWIAEWDRERLDGKFPEAI